MRLPALPEPGMAIVALDENCVAFPADAPAYIEGQMRPCSLGDATE